MNNLEKGWGIYRGNLRRKPSKISVRQIFSSVSRFSSFSNRKSRHTLFLQIANLDTHMCPDFLKCVQIFVLDEQKLLGVSISGGNFEVYVPRR